MRASFPTEGTDAGNVPITCQKGTQVLFPWGLQAAGMRGHLFRARASRCPPISNSRGLGGLHSHDSPDPDVKALGYLCSCAHHMDEGAGAPRGQPQPRAWPAVCSPEWSQRRAPAQTCSHPQKLSARCRSQDPKATLRFSIWLEGPRTQGSCCAQGDGSCSKKYRLPGAGQTALSQRCPGVRCTECC